MNVCIMGVCAPQFVFLEFDQKFQMTGGTPVLSWNLVLSPRWGPAA